ncbi:MAG: hypothetical protein SCARUB_04620 [Candidatus Scalindua rubra]|uniref:DUF1640 domain-containing protein n=1 Tax=Candidatus Scalindua rubra TaxID=1872076 RepID=A0A1E3X3U5_9BACT|nr:MAG: hypothetical protein SCARUB_04620 [Candidatus Scalindua rubra]
MSTITFDTLAYAKKLKSVGFTEEQAEAQAEAQKEMLSEVLETTLATKSDIDRLDKQIVVLKWMMGVMLAGVVSLVMKAFFIP